MIKIAGNSSLRNVFVVQKITVEPKKLLEKKSIKSELFKGIYN